MGVLQDKLTAVTAEAERKATESDARQRRENREATMELALQVFGEDTGAKAPPRRPAYKGQRDQPVYRFPDGMDVQPDPRHTRRVIVDGVRFERTYGTNASPELCPVLVCPDCGEEHLGSQVYRSGSSYAWEGLAEELKTQRKRYSHSCYESGTAAVLSAARLGASRAKGITAGQLIARAAQQLGWGDR